MSSSFVYNKFFPKVVARRSDTRRGIIDKSGCLVEFTSLKYRF